MRTRNSGLRLKCAAGFTLVEIMVALAIVAVALVAGFRSVAQSTDGAALLQKRTLALWVAQNQLAIAQLENQAPSPGEQQGNADQGGVSFVWTRTASGTPNPAFSKLEISVAEVDVPTYPLARITGYVGQTVRR